MGDTIKSMEIKKVDELVVESLEIGDMIGYRGDIVEVISMFDQESDGTLFCDVKDEWGEVYFAFFAPDTMVDFYYPVEEGDDD